MKRSATVHLLILSFMTFATGIPALAQSDPAAEAAAQAQIATQQAQLFATESM